MVAGLDHKYSLDVAGRKPEVLDLWLSIAPSQQHVPGVRQTLDWIESCMVSLSWLNDPMPA
jgi:hypothetical protein